MPKPIKYVLLPGSNPVRYFVSDAGEIFGVRKLKLRSNPSGYLVVALFEGKKPRWKTVHCLVAENFIGPRPKGMTIDHKNENKQDNGHRNLEYVTHQENINRSWKSGKRKPNPNLAKYRIGCKPPNRKFTDEQAMEVIAAYVHALPKISMQSVGKRFGISASSVHRILKGKIVYKNLPRSEQSGN